MRKFLDAGYSIKALPTEKFQPIFLRQRDKFFGNGLIFDPSKALPLQELDAMGRLAKNMGTPYRLNLALYHQDELVGWLWGQQENREKFYMVNAVIYPEHRRQGLYTWLMSSLVREVTDAGFQIVTSCHTASNNAILIPKLKFGFLITGIEVSDVFGLMVNLSYYANPLRRKVMDFRTGQIAPDDELRKYLHL